jgi:uncharacterized protein YgiM (DUF1202 family)
MALATVQTGNSAGVNIRATKSTSATLLGVINNGVQVNVVRVDSTWATLQYNNTPAFVQHQYLTGAPASNGAGLTAGNGAKCNGDSVNVRSSAPSGGVVSQLNKGSAVTVQSITTASDGYVWYQIGSGQWVRGDFLAPNASGGSSGGGTTPTGDRYGQVNASPNVNIRASASTSGTNLGKWPNGRIGIVTSYNTDWYKTNWKGQTAYVLKQYINDIGAAASNIPDRIYKILSSGAELGITDAQAVDYYGIGSSSVAWCQLFVNFVQQLAGTPNSIISTSANTFTAAQFYIVNGSFWFKNLNNKLNIRAYSGMSSYVSNALTTAEQSFVPQVGDLIYYRFDANDHTSHVGFVYSVNAGANTLTAIEGNRSNAVSYRTGFSYLSGNSDLVGFARPVY